jgi:hypothetical protein
MFVTEITVHAGRTFNHPHESYSNFKPGVSMTATIEPGEDSGEATKLLQARAEGAVEDLKSRILSDLQAIRDQRARQSEEERLKADLESAETNLKDFQARFNHQRALQPANRQLAEAREAADDDEPDDDGSL